MKLLVVTSLKEYQKTVTDTETIGYKDHHRPNLLDDWFSSGGDHFNSVLLFSFTSEANAECALDLVMKYNAETKPAFPIRAFIVPVDESSYDEII